jgi:hypothetical protein
LVGRGSRIGVVAVGAVVGTLLGVGPSGAAAPPGPIFQPIAPSFQGATLTRDTADTFRLDASAGTVTVRGNAGVQRRGSGRGVFWPTGQIRSSKYQVCSTWLSQQGPIVQQGVALRIKPSKNGHVKAITVTKNIFTGDPAFPGTSIFNVHVWNTRRIPVYTHIATFDLKSAIAPQGTALPLPWRMCARVQGRQLRFQVWVEGQPKPGWGSPASGGTVALPPGARGAGLAGWYIGHLGAGDSATFTKLAAGPPTATLP